MKTLLNFILKGARYRSDLQMDSCTLMPEMPDENTDANDISSATLPPPLESADIQDANIDIEEAAVSNIRGKVCWEYHEASPFAGM